MTQSSSADIMERLREFAAYGDDARGRVLAQLALTEIDRLREAKRSALKLADERAKEAAELRQALNGAATPSNAEISRLRTQVEYWRLAAERREMRKERSGLDIPEARTLDAPLDDAQGPWKPIQTAPKMKTILLFAVTDVAEDGRILNWRMATGSWHTGYENDEDHSPWDWGRQLYKWETQPTHWMPLPEAPSISSTTRETTGGANEG